MRSDLIYLLVLVLSKCRHLVGVTTNAEVQIVLTISIVVLLIIILFSSHFLCIALWRPANLVAVRISSSNVDCFEFLRSRIVAILYLQSRFYINTWRRSGPH